MPISQEQINEWKAKHGEVYAAKSGENIVYLKKPNRKEIGYASVAGNNGNPVAFNEALLKGCFLGGDDPMLDDNLFLSVSSVLGELVKVEVATLEKL